VLFEVGFHELRERESSRDPAFSSKPLELPLKRIPRVLLRSESAPRNLAASAADDR
jgi:hypothetical protein